jgi:sugar phosphate isomerase/epimerase
MLATDRVLCASPMRDRGFREHVEAAAAAGWDSISIQYPTYVRARDSDGLSDGDMRSILADNGIGLDELEVCHDWAYGGQPGIRVGTSEPALNCSCGICAAPEEMARIGEALQASTLIATNRLAPQPVEVTAERLAALCDLASDHGMRVAVEFVPYSAMRNVTELWNVIEATGRESAGFCFDTHHHLSIGGSDEALAQVPAERFFLIQVSDGVRLPDASRAELYDLMMNRKVGYAVGDGELDVLGTLRTLEQMGVRTAVGVEGRKPEFARLTALEVATDMYQRLDRYLAAADGGQ